MTRCDFENINVTPKQHSAGVWYGTAVDNPQLEINHSAGTANLICAFLAGPKAVEIASRGYEFAYPERDEEDLSPEKFTQEKRVGDALLVPSSVLSHFHELPHGAQLKKIVGEDAVKFGLVVPGRGTIFRHDYAEAFAMVAGETEKAFEGQHISAQIASRAIRIARNLAEIVAQQ